MIPAGAQGSVAVEVCARAEGIVGAVCSAAIPPLPTASFFPQLLQLLT